MNRRLASPAAVLTAGLLLLVPGRLAAFWPGPGLLGLRAYGLDPGIEHYYGNLLGDAFGATAGVNLPVLPGFNATLSYSAAHLTTSRGGRSPEMLSISAVDYTDASYGRSYVSVTVGHAWDLEGLMGGA
jgi:hypothetical protein